MISNTQISNHNASLDKWEWGGRLEGRVMAQMWELHEQETNIYASYFSCPYKSEQATSKELYWDAKLNTALSHPSSVFSPTSQNDYHLRKQEHHQLVLTLLDHSNRLLKAFIPLPEILTWPLLCMMLSDLSNHPSLKRGPEHARKYKI